MNEKICTILYIPFSVPGKIIQKKQKVANFVGEDVQEAQGLSPRKKTTFFFLCPLRVLLLPAVFQQSEPFGVFFLRTRSQPKKKYIGTLGDFWFKSFSLLFKIFYNIFKNISELLQKGGESANSLIKKI